MRIDGGIVSCLRSESLMVDLSLDASDDIAGMLLEQTTHCMIYFSVIGSILK